MTEFVNLRNKSPSFSSDHDNCDGHQFSDLHSNDNQVPYRSADIAAISRVRSSEQLKDHHHHHHDKGIKQGNRSSSNNINIGEYVQQSESHRESKSQARESLSHERNEISDITHDNNNNDNEDRNETHQDNDPIEWPVGRITSQASSDGPWKLPPGLAEELMELQETNEALKGLLRRNNGKGIAELHYRLEKTERSLKEKNAMLKDERDRNAKTESKFLEYKSQAEKIIYNKDTDIKKLTDINASLRVEIGALRDKHRESESIIQIGTTENMRLLQLCKQNNITVHPYVSNSNGKTVRQERVESAVPSTKKNFFKMSNGVYTNECLSVPRNKSINRDDRPTTPTSRYKRGSQNSSVSGYRNEPLSPNVSTYTTDIKSQAGEVLYIGQETTWKGLTGIIRYIGPVDELHRGTWVGVEFDEGRGEHSGNILGIHYFSAAPRSSVFCRPEELGPSRVKVSTNLEAAKKDGKAMRMKSPARTHVKAASEQNKAADTKTDNVKEETQPTPSKEGEMIQSGSYKIPPPPSTMKRTDSPHLGSSLRGKTGHHDHHEKKKKMPGLHHVVEMNINKKKHDTNEDQIPDENKGNVLPEELPHKDDQHDVSEKINDSQQALPDINQGPEPIKEQNDLPEDLKEEEGLLTPHPSEESVGSTPTKKAQSYLQEEH